MASTPIGGLRVDLSLNSAAFIRDIAKTNQAIATNTRAMQGHLTRLQATANKVGGAFGAWLTTRTIRRVVTFLDQSIDLAAKLDNELGAAARQWQRQGAEIQNAFQLGVAQGFLDQVSSGLNASGASMEALAKAGIVVGNVLGRVFTSVVNFLTVEIPNGVNTSIAQLNSLITGFNSVNEAINKAVVSAEQFFGVTSGRTQTTGNIPTIEPVTVEGQIQQWVDLSSAAGLAANASDLAAQSQKNLGASLHKTTDKIIAELNAMDALRQKQAEAAIQTTQQWLGVADTIGQALGVLFKENKAVAIAQAVINTAQAITEAMKLPFPINWAQVAAVTALGAAQIATIASSEPGTSKAIKKGGGTGASAPAKAGSASKGGGGGGSLRQAVNINVTGESFGPEHFRRLVSGLNAVIADGATLKVQ
jgi:hypothetical protein